MTKNTNTLKIIACIAMVIDHTAAFLLNQKSMLELYIIMRFIGRLAFPLFAYCTVIGNSYTKNIKKYLIRLLIFACISQIPYFFLVNNPLDLNIIFTLLLGVILIRLFSSFKKNWQFIVIFIALYSLLCILGVHFDYGVYGLLLMLLFQLLKDKKWWFEPLFIYLILASYLFLEWPQMASVFSILVLVNWRYKEIKLNKYFFYVFYPAHLIIIFIIKCFL